MGWKADFFLFKTEAAYALMHTYICNDEIKLIIKSFFTA